MGAQLRARDPRGPKTIASDDNSAAEADFDRRVQNTYDAAAATAAYARGDDVTGDAIMAANPTLEFAPQNSAQQIANVTIKASEPTTYVNQKLPDGTFFTGVGSTLVILVVDQAGKEIKDVTLKETVTSPDSDVKQNPKPVGRDENGNLTDLVGYGKSSDTKINNHEAIEILQEVVQKPHTRHSTQTLEISVGGRVVGTASYDRTLSNVDKDGNLRNYINPKTGNGMANYTIETSTVRFRLNQ